MKASVRILKEGAAAVDPRLFSSFIEHMGRAVYTGIYEPGHPEADERGFRRDVEKLIRPLKLSHIRYPGGNFLSGYDWRDGVGPQKLRPVRPELAWQAIETNEVGTDEFLQWCERLQIQPMLGVNLGTGTPRSAVELLEYVNGALPTCFADRRRSNGHAAPYGVKLWCLGNEMDGPWQICAKTAEEYGRLAAETAKMMKLLDPSIELVACGSSYRSMPTFGAWEKTVLRHCYPYVDYLSLHQYYQNLEGDIPSFLSRSVEMSAFIEEVAGICREAKAFLHSDREVKLSFDEWNVWYHFEKEGAAPPKWTQARPIEEEKYDMADALLVGCMLNSLITHADTVKIACLAQLVNVIAPIMTEPGGPAWVQTIYYPFLYASRWGRGEALKAETVSPAYDCALRRSVPYLDAAAVKQADGSLALFLINRSEQEPIECAIAVEGGRSLRAAEWISLNGCGPEAVNSKTAAPVQPKAMTGVRQEGGALTLALSPFSWNLLHLS